MKPILLFTLCGLSILLTACSEEAKELKGCEQLLKEDLQATPETRDRRFLGKVSAAAALCRGGERAVEFRKTPWVDWSQYWGTGGVESLPKNYISQNLPALRGVTGALIDLEHQRVNLIKFNLFDNNGTYKGYVSGSGGVDGRAIKVWPEMRLPKTNPNYQAVGGGNAQECKGELIRGRTTTGICNDILNPLMGSAGTPFARNVEFETSFPDLGLNSLTKNRHGNRLGLLTPDPEVISRKLLTRIQSPDAKGCNAGFGSADNSPAADCDYQKASFFNVLAAYWIQFMTHDWFSHMEEGHNATIYIDMVCTTQLVNGVPTPLTPADVQKLGCRPGDRVDKTLVADDSLPESFKVGDKTYLARAQDVRQQQHGLVGRLAALRIRRNLKKKSEAGSQGRGTPAAGSGGRSFRHVSPSISGGRSDSASMDGPGGGGLSRQLDHWDEFLPQPVRPGTQFVRSGIP
jgi:hypothetical protein